jgi:plasmid stabilization system protein ParE
MVGPAPRRGPEAFDEDFTQATNDIAETPFIGKPAPARKPGLRKLLLPRIRCYVYYRVISENEIEVVCLWHGSRRPPAL